MQPLQTSQIAAGELNLRHYPARIDYAGALLGRPVDLSPGAIQALRPDRRHF